MFTFKNKAITSNKHIEENTCIISLPETPTHTAIPIPSEQFNNTNQTRTDDGTSSNIVYKIVKPEDLDLKPSTTKYLPRGRPRKKVCVEKNDDDQKKVVKHVRTRSGRITKPPKHIEVDFKKIDITDDSDLKTVEFEPLKTNDSPVKPEPLLILEQHCKKRNIPPRYRCPTCNKAYLGKAKMLNHFEKHPDHGTVPANVKYKNTATWDFLVLTAQKFKGSKVAKFCEELSALLENAKKIAKYLFKPVCNNEEGYFITNQLASVFGIKEGKYSLDDGELSKDISLYEYLETNINKKHDEKYGNTLMAKDNAKITVNVDDKIKELDLLNNHINNQSTLALVKYEIPKLFHFNTPTFPTDSVDDSNYDHQGIDLANKSHENKCLEEKKEMFHHLQKDMTLQNELHDVDELMLENVVDTGQVSILETSSNSDDIMNVDQFVNERFKKLTEPDIDIQSNSLNLELPPLDIFQFHTS